MSGFGYALLTMLLWGSADLFYKTGAKDAKYSHLRTAVSVGLVMGAHAIFTLLFGSVGLFSDTPYDFYNIIAYLPVSAMYIISMTVGYFGLKYLELSVSSPIQNASGAVVCILCAVVLKVEYEIPVIIAVAVITVFLVALGFVEREEIKNDTEKKYSIGMIAFFIPVAYCFIDALGTFLDGFYLDDISSTPLRATEETLEDTANTSYELTFFIVAIVLLIYLLAVKKEKLFIKTDKTGREAFLSRFSRLTAAVFETAGQYTYVYAMSGNAAIAAPMVSAYAVVSMLLSAIFLKERLSLKQYICIFAVIAGVIVLGIYDV